MLIVRQIRGTEFSLRVFSYGSCTIKYCRQCWFCDKSLLQVYLLFFSFEMSCYGQVAQLSDWQIAHLSPVPDCLEWKITTSLANGQDITGSLSVSHAQWPCWETCTSSMGTSAATNIAGAAASASDFIQPWPLQVACTGFGRLYSGQEKSR